MGEFARWALLGAAILTIIALILSLPVFQDLPGAIGEISRGCGVVVQYAGSFLYQARGIVNWFVFPGVEPLLTVVILWVILKPFQGFAVDAVITVYHWIFK